MSEVRQFERRLRRLEARLREVEVETQNLDPGWAGPLSDEEDELPAWVEELASEWERQASAFRAHRSPGGWSWYDEMAAALERCAADTRKRVKGEP